MSFAFVPDTALIVEHRGWLDQFEPMHRRSWETLLNNDPEGASCEAGFRRLLQQNNCSVTANEKVNERGKKPDFRCQSRRGIFYFEATCIRIETVVSRYRLSPDIRDLPKNEVFAETTIVPLFFEECRSKADQCAGMDAPTVLGISTFHRPAGWMSLEVDHVDELLTGRPEFRLLLEEGVAANPIQVASLTSSFGLRYGAGYDEVQRARRSISAIVLARPNRAIFDDVIGVIHPDASRPFDYRLLPHIPFRRLVINDSKRWCKPGWADDGDDLNDCSTDEP